MAKIDSVQRLRALYRQPAGRAVSKQLDRLDVHCRRFIALSPFLLVGSHGRDGLTDVSPRGEAPGFAQVPDDRTVLIPDRPGNNRLDSFENILCQPAVGLLFLVPGVQEMLRVNGTAEIRDDDELLNRFVVQGRRPITVLKIAVKEAYLHCAKAILRSRLWDEDAKVDRSVLPSMGQMINDQVESPAPAESQGDMLARYRDILY